MNGIIVVDKPKRFTSFDVVAVLRGITKTKKIGHTGTLDPMATGVLPVLIGRCTRAESLLPVTDKVYEADFQLGLETDTQDFGGRILQRKPANISLEEMKRVLLQFKGDILQVPPMYSALKRNGMKLVDLARKGIEVEREARPVHISELQLLSFDEREKTGALRIECTQGTYVRTLIHDIGQILGCGAVMTELRRTMAAGFTLEEAVDLFKLKENPGSVADYLLPAERLFTCYETIGVTEAQARRFLNGGELDEERLTFSSLPEQGQIYRMKGPEDIFIGLGIYEKERRAVKVLRLFLDEGQ